MEKLVKIGRELGIKDDHKYVMVECPECHKERWVRVDRLKGECFYCSRGFKGVMNDSRKTKISNSQKERLLRDGIPEYFYRDKSGSNNPMFGKQQTIASIEKNRQSQLNNWKDPEHQRKWMLANIYPHVKQTKPEKELEVALQDCGLEFVGDGKFWIGYPPRNPDFIHRKNRKIVEFFGNYWHKPDDEQDRINHYNKYGWDCFIIWEIDYNTNKELTIAQVKEFIQ
jgi:G:T-mismatch repair DNA endonuclease (very short patch repair protein)